MRKKSRTKQSPKTPQPERAQLKAIDRLLEGGKYKPAIEKCRALIRQFPRYGGLRVQLLEALERHEGLASAAVAAIEWSQARPNSVGALQALVFFSHRLGHLILADEAARRLQALGEASPGFPLPADLRQELLEFWSSGTVSEEQRVRFDIGQIYFQAQQFSGAAKWLENLPLTPAKNNRALAFFHLQEIDRALATFLELWEADPNNLFASGWVVQLRLYLGDEEGARGLATSLGQATARRIDEGPPQLLSLLLLGENRLALDAFQRGQAQPWAENIVSPSGAIWLHFGACAKCRAGEVADAERLWKKAVDVVPDLPLAKANLELSGNPEGHYSAPLICDMAMELPITWIDRNVPASKASQQAMVGSMTASNAYLQAAYFSGDAEVRGLIPLILKARAKAGDVEAGQALIQMLAMPVGNRQQRGQLLQYLQDQGLIAPDEPVALWNGREVVDVTTINTLVYSEPKPMGLPADLLYVLEESIALQNVGRLAQAEALLQRILGRIPEHPVALGNLAVIRDRQGKRDEAVGLLRRAIEKDPEYLFGRCNLARFLILEGDVDEAGALLHGQTQRKELHIQEALNLYATLALLYRAQGKKDRADAMLQMLDEMAKDEDSQRRVRSIKRMVEGYDRVEGIAKKLRAVVQRSGEGRGER